MIQIHQQSDVELTASGGVRRRDFLRGISAAGMAGGALNWSDLMSVEASELRKRSMACILLWMKGGPSQFETFSPKTNREIGGETGAISTAVPGIQISAYLPETARAMQDICILRSMTSKEGSHPRASFLMHTGYVPTASVRYPTWGSIVTHEIADTGSDLPSFVRIGNAARNAPGAGFFGVRFDPFVMRSASRTPDNTEVIAGSEKFQRRLRLMNELGRKGTVAGLRAVADDHRELYQRAARLVLSPKMEAFEIDQEADRVREAYGRSKFGNGCLLARRLIESGVTFVEVTHGDWDTHQDNFDRSRKLCGEMDRPYAQLLRDLKDRGLLERTLVIWMGEFGRTPKINARGGRGHYPRAFNVTLAGAGVTGGQVIGATDAGGREVVKRPVSVPDLFRTFCQALRIDPDNENMSPIGRPIKIVEGGRTVDEVFG